MTNYVKSENPFNVTKAVDFSDKQILDFWVDLHEESTLKDLAKPTSQTPMIIEGGKGSGKTHLMRYLTLTSQLLRCHDNIEDMLVQDRYVGIYVRFSGLNASRFKGKNQSDEVWSDVFGYYAELWLGQLFFGNIERLAAASSQLRRDVAGVDGKLSALLTEAPRREIEDIGDFLLYLREEQRIVDHAINNCGLTNTLDICINLNRGGLIFDGCRLIGDSSPLLRDVVFVFLLDEYENLDVPQQKYINTIIREKRSPANFKVGTRSYGIRTFKTLSADETLVEGSDFHLLRLDENLREKPKQYNKFCRRMICRRLREASDVPRSDSVDMDPSSLDRFFATGRKDYLLGEQTQFVLSKYAGRERPYFKKLRQQIQIYGENSNNKLGREGFVNEVIQNLEAVDHPLIEKVHALQFYRDWAHRRPLLKSSRDIRQQYQAFLFDPNKDGPYRKILDKFKGDLFSQLLRQCDQRQQYDGLNTLIATSSGLPRNLLVVLKHVYTWAEFRGERPFHDRGLSIEAQHRGMLDASRWFFENARIPGDVGRRSLRGIARLAELFREIRFSDKPSECSIVTFSINVDLVDKKTRDVLIACEKWSLLIRIPLGQKDKNSMRVDSKFQLSPMLAPLWELPVARRGAIAVHADEVRSIFYSDDQAGFDRLVKSRLRLMNAPFGRQRNDDQSQEELTLGGN